MRSRTPFPPERSTPPDPLHPYGRTAPPAPPGPSSPSSPSAPAHPADEVLPMRRMVPAALQHVASMYAGLAAPPLIIGGALGLTAAQLTALLAASLVVAGLTTVAQTFRFWGVGAGLPVTNGVSFAVVSPLLAASVSRGQDALALVFGATLVAGTVCFLLAPPSAGSCASSRPS